MHARTQTQTHTQTDRNTDTRAHTHTHTHRKQGSALCWINSSETGTAVGVVVVYQGRSWTEIEPAVNDGGGSSQEELLAKGS